MPSRSATNLPSQNLDFESEKSQSAGTTDIGTTDQATITLPLSGYNLPFWRKCLILFVVSWMTLAATFSISCIYPATEEIADEFDTTSEAINLSNAGALIAASTSSLVWVPLTVVSNLWRLRLLWSSCNNKVLDFRKTHIIQPGYSCTANLLDFDRCIEEHGHVYCYENSLRLRGYLSTSGRTDIHSRCLRCGEYCRSRDFIKSIYSSACTVEVQRHRGRRVHGGKNPSKSSAQAAFAGYKNKNADSSVNSGKCVGTCDGAANRWRSATSSKHSAQAELTGVGTRTLTKSYSYCHICKLADYLLDPDRHGSHRAYSFSALRTYNSAERVRGAQAELRAVGTISSSNYQTNFQPALVSERILGGESYT